MTRLNGYIIVLLFVIFGFTQANVSLAEDRYDVHGELITPQALLTTGMIDGIAQNAEVYIIDDTEYFISKDTIYTNENGSHIDPSLFTPGMNVNFYLKGSEITKIWPGNQDDAAVVNDIRTPVDKKYDVKLEDGVWKN